MDPSLHHSDAHPPAEIARKVERLGVAKAKTDTVTLLVLAVLAGAFISLGALLFTVVITGSGLGYGMTRLVGGLAFCLGLVLVVVAGAELFTGNNLLAMAWVSRLIGTREVLRNWFLAYLGNVVGCLGTILLVLLADIGGMGGGAVGETAVQIARGSLMLLSGVEYGFFEPKEFGRGLATGTFINRNHYANLLVLALAAGIGLLLAQMDLRGVDTIRQRLRSFVQATLGPKARLRIFLVVIVIALVLTRSRMGNASFFAALTLVGLFALWRLRQHSRPLVVLVVSVLIIDVLVVGTWFGMEQVIDRIQQTVQLEEDEWVVKDRNRIDADRE